MRTSVGSTPIRRAYRPSTATIGLSAKLRRHARLSLRACTLVFDDRHAVQSDLASRRRDAAHRAHQRIDAGRQAFADERSRVASARLELPDHARDPQVAQNMAKDHGRDDIAAARIEKDNAAQICIPTARFEEIDERLRSLRLDDAVGDDHGGTPFAAVARLKRATRKVIDPPGSPASAGAAAASANIKTNAAHAQRRHTAGGR